eukprot:GEMP01075435.1.p2 GENE.GEMP01075435.1~~GEMP01075435.1.p2  ORF type:complete len:107 (+),score=20.81 GEMP01075435.1:311-631(+)
MFENSQWKGEILDFCKFVNSRQFLRLELGTRCRRWTPQLDAELEENIFPAARECLTKLWIGRTTLTDGMSKRVRLPYERVRPSNPAGPACTTTTPLNPERLHHKSR